MGRRLVVEQLVTVAPDRAYAAWTSADALSTWWWPHIADTSYEVDARAGGRHEIRSETAGIGVRGAFLELDEPRLLRMSWTWMDDGLGGTQEEVHIGFRPTPEGCLVTVTHDLDESSGDGEDLRQGWHDVLARLAKGTRS